MVRAITTRILRQILLVIVLRVIELRCFRDLCRDLPFARCPESNLVYALGLFSRLTLLRVQYVDCRAILRACIVALAHPLSGIVRLPENPQQGLVGNNFRIVDHPHNFSMTREAGAHLFVCRIGCVPASVAHCSRIHPGKLPEKLLRPPKTSEPEYRLGKPSRKRRYHAPTAHKMSLRNGEPGAPSRKCVLCGRYFCLLAK